MRRRNFRKRYRRSKVIAEVFQFIGIMLFRFISYLTKRNKDHLVVPINTEEESKVEPIVLNKKRNYSSSYIYLLYIRPKALLKK